MGAGAENRDFFGLSQGMEDGQYVGFSCGMRKSLIMDSSLLLVEPVAEVILSPMPYDIFALRSQFSALSDQQAWFKHENAAQN
jgi:hypothetical protein